MKDKKTPDKDSKKWGVPSNPSKFSGWNAALGPVFAMAVMIGALAYDNPPAAQGIIKTMSFDTIYGDDVTKTPKGP